jgi:hypothetical protein
MVKFRTRPVFRVLNLFWRRMGAARFYVLAAASVLIVLAAIGLFHLRSVAKQFAQNARGGVAANAAGSAQHGQQAAGNSSARPQKTNGSISDATQGDQASRQTMPLPAADDAIADHPVISITEVASRGRRVRHGDTRVDVKIGVAPQPNASKGEVEIRVFFFDVTRNREIRPTQGQVAYQWLTPVRDWTDPTPKYLVATYLHRRAPHRSPERLRYGGCIVRVYLDGQLQDERSEPKGLLAALRSDVRPRSAPGAMPAESSTGVAAAVPSPSATQLPNVKTELATNAISPSPTASAIPAEKRSTEELAALPYARPVPDKPGFVYSPFDEKFVIDVRGFPPGTVVNDPHASKPFRIP